MRADFVQWYQPDALDDVPAGRRREADQRRRRGRCRATPTSASLLFEKGLIQSPLAFQWAVIEAGREGTLQAGTYDLSPTLKPSEIVAALQQEAGPEVTVTIRKGWRLEEIVGYLRTTKLTMNMEEFAALARIRRRPDPRVRLPGRSAQGPHAGGLPLSRYLSDRRQLGRAHRAGRSCCRPSASG